MSILTARELAKVAVDYIGTVHGPDNNVNWFFKTFGPSIDALANGEYEKSLTVSLRISSAMCASCCRDDVTMEVDGTLIIPSNREDYSPQLFYCQHCKIFFCQGESQRPEKEQVTG
jgi:hypothetical protein